MFADGKKMKRDAQDEKQKNYLRVPDVTHTKYGVD